VKGTKTTFPEMYNNASMQIYGIFLTSATIFEELIS